MLFRSKICSIQFSFGEISFAEADLTEADFTKAELNGANFSGAKVTPEQLGKAKSLEGVIMPDGSMPYGVYIDTEWTPEWYMARSQQP